MKLPIIISENGDLSFYEKVEEAELYLEATDVKNNEYRAYDASGKLLSLEIETRGEPPLDFVVVCENENSAEDVKKLREILRKFLFHLNISTSEASSLQGIIKKCIDRVGYTS
jgi:spore coat polysaccharide biosynthesis predicted glycosyltransferase SpsG